MNKVALFIGSHNEEIEVEAPLIPQILADAGYKVFIFNPIGGWNWIVIRKITKNDEKNKKEFKQSCIEAAKTIKCEKILYDFDVGRSADWKAKVTQVTAETLSKVNPDIIFMHWIYDSHPDHRAMVQITFQAVKECINLISDDNFQAKWKEVWAYSAGREQSLDFVPDVIVGADEIHMENAFRAIDMFNYPENTKNAWKQWMKQKFTYWAPFDKSYRYGEPLKFIGPSFPSEGTLLKQTLGKRVINLPMEYWLRA